MIRAIRARVPDATFEGIAGPEMAAAGCEQWEEAEALAVFGLIEPLAHIPRLLRLRRSLIRRWRDNPPDVFVGIDAPDFNLGLEKALRKSGIKTVHYVSPTVWAWRQGRIRKIRRSVDLMLCLFPFEEPWFRERGVNADYVGHPLARVIRPRLTREAFSAKHGLDAGQPVVVLLPDRGDRYLSSDLFALPGPDHQFSSSAILCRQK